LASFDREGLIEEAAGGVVVDHGHPRAGDEIVGGGNVENGDGFARMRLTDHADLDRERLVGADRDHRSHEPGERPDAKRAHRLQPAIDNLG
jgi:hypothetical protein